jgi:two-component system NarL family sensor kinase
LSEWAEIERRFQWSVRYPLLIECDTWGNVLWMSERTRLALGRSMNLLETIPWDLAPGNPVTTGRSVGLCFTRLWQAGGKVVVGARGSDFVSETEGLLRIQISFLHHYIRLQIIERNLSSRVRDRRRRSGFSPVRQIELERQRLGTELHTSVGQSLSAIRMQLEVVASQLTSAAPMVQQALDRISTLAADALEQVRSISKRLHPPEWQRLTLEAAIQQVWDLSGIPQRFESHLRIDALPGEPDLDAKVLIYRAAQEAVSNVIRHSGATRIEASLEAPGDKIILRFQDNGVGFDAQQLFSAPPNLAGGIGLRTIREQAEALGGTIEIASGPGGTKLEITVPFLPAHR